MMKVPELLLPQNWEKNKLEYPINFFSVNVLTVDNDTVTDILLFFLYEISEKSADLTPRQKLFFRISWKKVQ